jgi:very-short-patch-repair endonuclease
MQEQNEGFENSPSPPAGEGGARVKRGKVRGYLDPTTVSRAKNLRHTATDAETLLWRYLRNGSLSLRFRRQQAIPPYIVDFFCAPVRLVVEIDGGQHTPGKDADRTRFLEHQNLRVIRFWNHDVLQNIDGVIQAIQKAIYEQMSR